MNETSELTARIEHLEERIAHQEAALEELTHAALRQEQALRQQADSIDDLRRQLRSLAPATTPAPADDEVPPHY